MSKEFTKNVTIGTPSQKNQDELSTNVEEREFTSEESANQLRAKEEDFLQGLVEAAGYKDDAGQTTKIEIVRPDRVTGDKKVLFYFHVRGLSEQEYNKCKKRATKYIKNKSLGLRMPEDTDSVKYRSSLIYEATIQKDRENLWDNQKVWESLRAQDKQIVCGRNVIEECLKAGEIDSVIDVIDRLSGYSDNIEDVSDNLEDTIKN